MARAHSELLDTHLTSGNLRAMSRWILGALPSVASMALSGCGGETDRLPDADSRPSIEDCKMVSYQPGCELSCFLPSGDPVGGRCTLDGSGPGDALACGCTSGPSADKFFSVDSCEGLEAAIAAACAESSPMPACPAEASAGQACSHRQSCMIETFRGDCSPGEAVASTSVMLDCRGGVWYQTGQGEVFCSDP